MEHISQSLAAVRERYLHPTPDQKISDRKGIQYREAIGRRGYAANPDCPVCHGAGFVHPLDDGDQVVYKSVIPCEAPGCLVESRKAYMGAEEPSRGDKTFSRKPQTFENFEQVEGARKVFEAFYLVAHSLKPPFLLCYGGLGNGKTHLCRATAKVLNSKGIWARYITMSDLMAMLKDSIPENKTSEVVQGLSEQPALIIDDWGVEYGTDWELSKLEDIIDKRYDAELLTIITSNKDFPQLEQMSRRITSRFKDSLLSKLVLNEAPDYRPRRKKDHGAK